MHNDGAFAAAVIGRSARTLAASAVARQLDRNPDAVANYARGPGDLVLDTEVRLGYLAEALAADRDELFFEQLAWLKVLCAARGLAPEALRQNVECMGEELEDRLPESVVERVKGLMAAALTYLDNAPAEVDTYLAEDLPHIELTRRFLLAVLEGRESDAVALVVDAADDGMSIPDLLEHVVHRAQREVGRMWQMGEIAIAEEHYCTGIVTTVLTLLRVRQTREAANGRRVVTAAVSNESHVIGIQMVSLAFEEKGWSVVSLGANTPASAIIDAVRDFDCHLIALSVNTVLYVRQTADLIAALRSDPITAGTPILVGGQPFQTAGDLWQVVGADGCAQTAHECPAIAEQVLAR